MPIASQILLSSTNSQSFTRKWDNRWPTNILFTDATLIGRPLEVSLTKDSGVAGLIFVARQRLHREFRKEDPPIQAANEWMLRQFDEGRQTAVEWEEIADFFLEFGHS